MRIFPRPWYVKVIYAIFFACVIVVLLSLLTPFNSWISQPLITDEKPAAADAVIVLGGGLKRDCTLGKRVSERMLQGISLVQEGRAPTLVITGGRVPKTNCIESVEMKKFAISQGIPESSIITEERSTSTQENATFVKTLLEGSGMITEFVVTSPFHTKRACKIFRKQNITITCIPADPVLGPDDAIERLRLLKAIIREYGATVYYMMKGYI
jgi:uncharacterized SAM-binding protein YcdF (DUF218 family)